MPIIGFFRKLFDTSDFPARWHCGMWTPGHGWLHICSDLAIFGAYFSIPAILAYVAIRKRNVPLRGVVWLFVAFIFACGTTHLCEAIIFWHPIYRVDALAKLATAIVSWATVIAMVHYMPQALAMPAIKRRHDELQIEVAQRAREQDELSRTRDLLESRTSQFALRDRRARDAMRAANACAVRWEIESGRIVWNLGAAPCLELLGFSPPEFEAWSTILREGEVAQLREESRKSFDEGSDLDIGLTLFDDDGRERGSIRIGACPEPEADGEEHCMTGMCRVILPENTC